MITVKEMAELTGVSARTLRYYDQIGLLCPHGKTEAGYRLYNEKDVEYMQQILFFRELDYPLSKIKEILEDPSLDRNDILIAQREMLLRKKNRLERIIKKINDLLEGGQMDFSVFTKSEVEDMFQTFSENMTEEQKQIFIDQYGNEEEWRKQFIQRASTREIQESFKKVVELYGSKDKAIEASKNPSSEELQLSYQNRIGSIFQELAKYKDGSTESLEVKKLIGEYSFIMGQMFQMEDSRKMMLEIAGSYLSNEEIIKAQDSIYGMGSTVFIGKAIRSYYGVV